MLENDPRYARQTYFTLPAAGSTRRGRHDLARAEYLSRRNAAPVDPFSGRRR